MALIHACASRCGHDWRNTSLTFGDCRWCRLRAVARVPPVSGRHPARGVVAFVLARSLLRPWVERLLVAHAGGRFTGLDAAVAGDGWRFVCLLRISPTMPFALASYALGLTHIPRRDYFLGTLAALSALAGYVGIGALATQGFLTAGNMSGPGSMLSWFVLGASVLATAILVLRSGALLARCGFLPKRPARLATVTPIASLSAQKQEGSRQS